MTKLTEEILRAQTCPFEVQSVDGSRRMKITAIGFKYFLVLDEGREYAHRIDTAECYKLPEPEPKIVTMYECVDRYGCVIYLSEKYERVYFDDTEFSSGETDAARIPNGETMQLDISSDPWKWVVE